MAEMLLIQEQKIVTETRVNREFLKEIADVLSEGNFMVKSWELERGYLHGVESVELFLEGGIRLTIEKES
ncbi:hypothetical protein [Heyndrickxia ginsengihumi]|uniref:hypothetical protein n=1 Tax=Heyndrickxia ginsengihumi TaxID=363870 RepID=UPI003D202295